MSGELTLFDPIMALVAQNIKNREATPEESLIIDVAIVNNENQRRSLAWLAREGKTWKNIFNSATGENFTSFEEYGKFRLKLEKSSLHDLANSFHVQSILEKSSMLEKEIPLRSAVQLNKLPDSAIPETYQAAIELAREEGKKLGAKHVEEAVNEWKSKNESLQKDLTFTKSMLETESTKYQAASRQRDELRDNQQQVIAAKLSEERANLILENQQAIAEAKRERDNALNDAERMKREQAKAIADGVKRELFTMQNEIDTKQHHIESFNKRIDALREVESSLEREVGYLQTHKKCIEKIKDNLSFLTVSFSDAFDTGVIPVEVTGEWDAIFYAVSKIKKQMAEWRDNTAPLESNAVIGELVN